MRLEVEAGQISQMELMEWAMYAFGDASNDIWKTVRAERISRNVKYSDPSLTNWGDADTAGYNKLDSYRQAIGFESPYSDEDD